MRLARTAIELTDLATAAWGLVTISSKPGPDGVVQRQFVISGPAADAVRRGEALPPGIERGLWETGRVNHRTRPCHPGQALATPDGSLTVNCGVREVGNRIKANVMMVPRRQWCMEAGAVMLDEALVSLLPAVARVS